MTVGLTLDGDKALVHALNALQPAVYRRVLGVALGRSSRPVIAAARRDVAVESGSLKRAIGWTLKKYAAKGIMVAVIGARSGFKSTGEDGKVRDPSNYSHLVELGHRIVTPRSLAAFRERYGHGSLAKALNHKSGTGSRVPPHPFLEPALRLRQINVVQELKTALRTGIEREAKRAAAKARR